MTNRAATALSQAWRRLETVCRRLWEENSPAAVETQAILDEFKEDVEQTNALLAVVEERKQLEDRENEERLSTLRRRHEMESNSGKEIREMLENSLRGKDSRIDELAALLARKEKENLELRAQVLNLTAGHDESRNKALAEELEKPRKALEAMTLKQAELDAREARLQQEENSLLKRGEELDRRSQNLVQEYRKKRREIEDLKDSLQKSLEDLVQRPRS